MRAQTFGQCIDAVRALKVTWAPGSTEGKSEASILADLKAAELPLTPAVPLTKSLEEVFTFNFRPGDPLEPNCAVADVRSDGAEIWSSLKSPIWAREQIAENLALPLDSVIVHVAQGGGSFGRHLFCDAAFEAATISKQLGKPVKLMWHRTDSFRQGRCHPMVTSRVRVQYLGANVVAFDQRHTSVATDFTQGLGELLTATLATPPEQNMLQYSESIFTLTANVPYNFGAVTQLHQRGLPVQHVQHLERPQRLQPGGRHRHRADGRPGRQGDGPGSLQLPPRLRPRRPHAGRARQGGPGG